MKKRVLSALLTLALVLALVPAFAALPAAAGTNDAVERRTVLYSTSFEEDPFTSHAWGNFDIDQDNHYWLYHHNPAGGDYFHTGTGSVMSYSYDFTYNKPLSPNNWLSSGYVDIPYEGVTTVSFWVRGTSSNTSEEFRICYVDEEEGGAPTVIAEGTATTSWQKFSADVTEFKGRTVYFVISHVTPYSPYNDGRLLLDDFEVENVVTENVLLSEDFETDPFQRGWQQTDMDKDGHVWEFKGNYTPKAHGGSGAVFSESYGRNPDGPLNTRNWLWTPAVTIPDIGMTTLRFWARGYSNNNFREEFRIVYLEYNTAQTYYLDSKSTVTTGEWKEYAFDVSSLAGRKVYLIIEHYNKKAQYQLLLDDLSIVNAPDPYEIYAFDFETDPFDNDWTRHDMDGDGLNWFYANPAGTLADSPLSHGGTGAVCSESYYDGHDLTPNNWLVTPYIFVPAEGETTVSFWARGSNATDFAESFTVSYIRYGESVPTLLSGKMTTVNEWRKFTVALPERLNGKWLRICVSHADTTGMLRLYLDDFSVRCVPPAKPDVTKGDMDGDGEITVADALAALRIAAKLAEETDEAIAIGDIDGDNAITVSDALAILRVAAKLADESSLA
ncbi:MAG: choice-of-anchor J domain-containing protein [Clostridia bacterium]|nr:choice-of-anchor J domain-containing protein [Clostridia bacterium]